ncbi:MAG: peptide chain release factor 1 [Candidatus Omnitrophica bacterium]|nr:peptide chain release factor 1 [Candidatus Omnitrophota bacterium]
MLKESNRKRLTEASLRHTELQHLLAEPGTVADQEKFQKLAKEFASLTQVVELNLAYDKTITQIAEARHMIEKEPDRDLRAMAQEELATLETASADLESRINDFFDPTKNDKDLDVILEIRGGTGGAEASIFVGDLYRMYTKYAAAKGWKIDPIAIVESDKGLKEAIFSVSGKGASRRLKWESGTHRVQRVPETEASGRIHTSAATVAVLFEPEEVDLVIDQKDLKIDVYRSSGPGGQSVNTCDSAIRITHFPTGMVVVCQDERSQLKNRIKAMRVLRARLLEHMNEERAKKEAATRKGQVGSGDRSEKIRTYNFPDHRVTDHRIGFTTHQLPAVMEGDLDPLFDALLKAEEDARDLK